MMGISLGHLVVVGIVVLLFGSRRLPELGGALGRGIHAFKEGINGLGGEAALPKPDNQDKNQA